MDQLDWPVLLVDAQNCPLFLSSNGAALLRIQHRDRLNDYEQVLEPLLSLSSDFKNKKPLQLQQQLNSATQRIHDLTLTAADGRSFPGIGFTRQITSPEILGSSNAAAGAVMFYDVSQLEPVYKIINNSRLNRSYLIHCAATYGASFNSAHPEDSPAAKGRPQEAKGPADLLSLITSAVEIVDPMLMTTISVNVDVKTSALLEVNKTLATKLLAHLLIEAGDFLGAAGKIKMRAVLKYLSPERAKKKQQTETRFSEIIILATRTAEIPKGIHPIETHLFRHSFPRHYRVTLGDSELQVINEDLLLNGTALPPEGSKTSFGINSTISEEAFSDNLRTANHIANAAKLPFQVRRLRKDMLAIYLPLPLSTTNAIAY